MNPANDTIETNLQQCYDVDIDWSLIPPKLERVSGAKLKFNICKLPMHEFIPLPF